MNQTPLPLDIIDAISEGVAVIDRNLTVTHWNHAAGEITGWVAKNIVGTKLTDQVKFIREQNRQENFSAIKEVISTGKKTRQHNNTILLTKNGAELPVSIAVSPLFDREKKVTGAVVLFRDLSAEKDAFRLRSDFTYLQHQLRTPLVSVLWNLQLISESPTLDPKTKRMVSDTLISLESIQILFNRLIEVSQLDQGLITPKEKPTKVQTIVKQSIDSVADLAKKMQVEIVTTVENSTETLTTDPNIGSKILSELLKNAIQFSHPGDQVQLKITEPDSAILFEVIDQGIGIPLENQGQVFTKFFRGYNVPKHLPGAGLGLYLAMRYTNSLKGKIWFAAKENSGSIFSLLLPIQS